MNESHREAIDLLRQWHEWYQRKRAEMGVMLATSAFALDFETVRLLSRGEQEEQPADE